MKGITSWIENMAKEYFSGLQEMCIEVNMIMMKDMAMDK